MTSQEAREQTGSCSHITFKYETNFPGCQAILSVYDKTGLLDLAKGLIKNNVRLLASGGTAKLIRDGGFRVE